MHFSKEKGKYEFELCPVCTQFGSGYYDEGKSSFMVANDGILVVSNDKGAVEIGINYCPRCGRRLEDFNHVAG